LLDQAWGYENYPTTRTVDIHVATLRQKLEKDPANPVHFRTVHRVGYKFVPEGTRADPDQQPPYRVVAVLTSRNENAVRPDLPQLELPETADGDLALVHASKNGDIAAFEEIVKRYDRRLLRIAQNLMHNREDAEEVVQETFLKAFRHLDQFRADAREGNGEIQPEE
jgi:hypothetical protein